MSKILIITIMGIGFQFYFERSIYQVIMGMISILAFSTFICFLYSQFMKLNQKTISFKDNWWKFYLALTIIPMLNYCFNG
ncbi:hypothetical protein [Tenacibaculum sp. Cn5-34]|nr:hypothetical protein [Tenacibaculum sp. Cn5-34]MCF2935951.1 hypothetical protein [Tenacibaculum sp. Cn5-34]MCG7512512.1 hypothetical protein [Tenacibaculum sp. Cn5-46]